MPIFDAMLDVLRSLASAGAIALAAFGFGRPLVRLLRLIPAEPLAVAIWSVSLGLIAAGGLLLGLAAAGWLNAIAIWGLTLAGSLWALVEWASVCLGRAPAGRPRIVPPPACPAEMAHRFDRRDVQLALLFSGVVLVAGLVTALAPPTSHEVVSRSLEVPKNVLLNRGLAGRADERLTPNLVQLWSLWALALDGPVAANLMHWLLTLLWALAAVLLGRVFVGPRAAWIAGSLVLFCPGVQARLGIPLEDVPLGLLATLAACGACQASLQCETARWGVAAGAALGAAMATGPAGLSLALALAAACLYVGRSTPQQMRGAAALAARMLLVAALVTAPWLFVATPTASGSEGHTLAESLACLGPLLLVALGGVGFVRRLRGWYFLWFALAAYLLLAAMIFGTGGWWPVAVSWTGVAAAWVWDETRRLPAVPRSIVTAVALVLIASGSQSLILAASEKLAVASGWQTRRDFLLTREPTFRAASLINQIRTNEDALLSQDARGLYFSCPTTSYCEGRRFSAVAEHVANRPDLTGWARAAGFTYLLLAEPVAGDSSPSADETDGVASDALPVADQGGQAGFDEVIPILEYRFADDNNRSIRYRLLRLRGPRTAGDRWPPDTSGRPQVESVGRLPQIPVR